MQISVYIYICVCVCVQYTSVLYTCPIRKTFFLLVDSSFPYCLCVYHCLSMCYLICYMQNYTQLELYNISMRACFFPNANFTLIICHDLQEGNHLFVIKKMKSSRCAPVSIYIRCMPKYAHTYYIIWAGLTYSVVTPVASCTKSQDFAASQHSEKRCQRRPL